MTLTDAKTREGVATRHGKDLRCLFYNHQILGQEIPAETLQVTFVNLPQGARAVIQSVDDECGCAKTVWQGMGAPANLRRCEVDHIQDLARPSVRAVELTPDGRGSTLEITLKPHALCSVDVPNAFIGSPGDAAARTPPWAG